MCPATGAPTVHTEQRDGTFVITIDRPEARNAIDGATAHALADAVDQLDARDEHERPTRPASSISAR